MVLLGFLLAFAVDLRGGGGVEKEKDFLLVVSFGGSKNNALTGIVCASFCVWIMILALALIPGRKSLAWLLTRILVS